MRDRPVRVHVHKVHEILVRRGAVIAFEEIIDEHLPVASHVVFVALREGEVVNARQILADLILQTVHLLRKGFCVGVEVDEDEAAEHLHPHRLQREVAFIEAFDIFGVPRIHQPPVKVEGPGVIGTGDDVLLAIPFQQFMPAMGADIVEGAQFPIPPARHEHGLFVDARGDELALLSHLTDMTSVVPCAVEDRLFLRLEDRRVVVEPRRHRP